MHATTSHRFASASASGTDWRDTSKKVLEALNDIRTENDGFTFGFLYITDCLVEDAGNILDLFRSVLGIEQWVGSVGTVICGSGVEYSREPAISVMIARYSLRDFRVFPPVDIDCGPMLSAVAPWLENSEPGLSIVHGDPHSEPEPSHILAALEKATGLFFVGGLSSSGKKQVQIANGIVSGGMSGIIINGNIPAVTALSQGCKPVGGVHIVTRCNGNVIRELDGRRAFEVFSEDIKTLAERYTEKESYNIGSSSLFQQDPSRFKGDVHVAFPVTGSDCGCDYLVRNLVGIDPDEQSVLVAQNVEHGDRIVFVHRDEDTIRIDLTKTLLDLRARVKRDTGDFVPKGGLFISCASRMDLGGIKQKDMQMKLVQDIIGDIPLTGFYANGEISNQRLYGYSSVLVLFI